jgi:hypothetical protein
VNEIAVDRQEIASLIEKTRTEAEALGVILDGFSSTADGGRASEKIAFIMRAAMESADLAATTTLGLCAIAEEAVEDQMATEAEVLDMLDNFESENFG